MIPVTFSMIVKVVFFVLLTAALIAFLYYNWPKVVDMIGGANYYVINLVNLILH